MVDQTPQQGKVPLQKFLKDFRSTLSDNELRTKYGLSARGFVSLIKALLARGTITQDDLVRRKQIAVQRDLEKEHEFLAHLFICPNCGHPHPARFDRCPACGADASESLGSTDVSPDPLSATGRHFYVDRTELENEADEAPSTGDPAPAPEEVTETDRPGTSSPLKTVRSLISKLTKK